MSLRLEGYNGCFVIADTSAYTSKQFEVLSIQEDTVIASMSGTDEDSNAVDFATEFGTTGVTLKAGGLLTCPKGKIITAITLTSGSLIAYNKV